MKRIRKHFWIWCLVMVLLAGFLPAVSPVCYASYDQVASEDEKAASHVVGLEGMFPVYASDVADGTYEIEVESSSSMFRVEKALLTVGGGEMSAVLTLSGKGYRMLFMGTGREAAEADAAGYIGYQKDENGRYTYTVPVEALDTPIACAAYSTNREKWYERQILFEAASLPRQAVMVELPDYEALKKAAKEKRIEAMRAEKENAPSAEPAMVDLADGEYEISIDFSGGSGRSFVESPAVLVVRQKKAYAQIRWSSANYDYMKVGEEKYLPMDTQGNSRFEIPVPVFDEPFSVTGDTTAMGAPHEIEYTLIFHQDTIISKEAKGQMPDVGNDAAEGQIEADSEKMPAGKRMAVWLAMIVIFCVIFKVIVQKGGKRWFFLWVFLILQLSACKGRPDDTIPLTYSHSMELAYASGFAVDYYEDGFALIEIAGSERFLLVPEGKDMPEDMPDDIVILCQPVGNIYLVASAVMDMFVSMDALEQIRFSGLKPEAWYIPDVRAAMERGEILYAGRYSSPDYERILSEGCGLAIENTMISHTPQVKEQLEHFGIPVLTDYSSYEKEPLGRTEWVRLYGLLTGKEEAAEKAFAAEQEAFEAVAKERKTGETVAFFYITNDGRVNVRKSTDYLPKMIALAGGVYIFEKLGDEESASSSVTLQMEEFYAAAKDADYLIYNSTVDKELSSLEELLAKNRLLANCKAVQEGNVFCTTKNLYQSSMALGTITFDLHEMMAGKEENLTYLYRLE